MNKQPLPQMGERKLHIIEDTLASFSHSPISVLEWGSGGSTIHFSRFLEEKRISFTWVSIEYNRDWYELVRKNISNNGNVEMVLFDVGEDNPRRSDVPMDEYVQYPRTLNMKFDVIIIDGRKRARCLEVAKDVLSSHGVVFLDDAFRPRYWRPHRLYPDRRFLWRSFWRGRLQSPTFPDRMYNGFANTFYKVQSLLKCVGVPVPKD